MKRVTKGLYDFFFLGRNELNPTINNHQFYQNIPEIETKPPKLVFHSYSYHILRNSDHTSLPCPHWHFPWSRKVKAIWHLQRCTNGARPLKNIVPLSLKPRWSKYTVTNYLSIYLSITHVSSWWYSKETLNKSKYLTNHSPKNSAMWVCLKICNPRL